MYVRRRRRHLPNESVPKENLIIIKLTRVVCGWRYYGDPKHLEVPVQLCILGFRRSCRDTVVHRACSLRRVVSDHLEKARSLPVATNARGLQRHPSLWLLTGWTLPFWVHPHYCFFFNIIISNALVWLLKARDILIQ